jgi:hypothetical protein
MTFPTGKSGKINNKKILNHCSYLRSVIKYTLIHYRIDWVLTGAYLITDWYR